MLSALDCSINVHTLLDKKAQLSLTNPRDAWNPGQGSIKVIGNDTIQYIVYNFLLMFNSNYGSISQRFRDIWRQKYYDLEIQVRGHSKSSKVTPFDSLRMISY